MIVLSWDLVACLSAFWAKDNSLIVVWQDLRGDPISIEIPTVISNCIELGCTCDFAKIAGVWRQVVIPIYI